MSSETLTIESPILNRNERLAAELRERFRAAGVYVINVLSSPGSGKTSTILATDARLRDRGLRSAVIEGDIASDVDAQTMKEAGIPAVQINTGGLCHLEGNMIGQAVDALDQGVGLENIDVIFIENVGNLVCPVDFDLGENLAVMILSVPEGDDKPVKYPGIFQHAGAQLLNKVDVAPAFDFDMAAYHAVLDDLNPTAPSLRRERAHRRGDGRVVRMAGQRDRGGPRLARPREGRAPSILAASACPTPQKASSGPPATDGCGNSYQSRWPLLRCFRRLRLTDPRVHQS